VRRNISFSSASLHLLHRRNTRSGEVMNRKGRERDFGEEAAASTSTLNICMYVSLYPNPKPLSSLLLFCILNRFL
jgi:hypothetical protein